MSWGKVRPWAPMLGLVPLIWLSLYIMFWIDRAGCAEPIAACLGNAFGNWAGDVVMVGWVDTTLGAGLIAAIAALSVVWTAYYQRRVALADNAERRIVDLTMIMWMLKNLFERAGLHHAGREPGEAAETLRQVEALYPRLHEVNPGLVALVQMISMDMRRHLAAHPDDWGYASARCILLSKFFDNPRRLFDRHGNYVPSRPRLGPRDTGLLTNTGHPIETIDFAPGLFTWDDVQVAPGG